MFVEDRLYVGIIGEFAAISGGQSFSDSVDLPFLNVQILLEGFPCQLRLVSPCALGELTEADLVFRLNPKTDRLKLLHRLPLECMLKYNAIQG
jgi:hypothetical protein